MSMVENDGEELEYVEDSLEEPGYDIWDITNYIVKFTKLN